MNNAVCSVTGSWDSTTFYNNDEEVGALELHLEINGGRTNGYGAVCGGGLFSDSEIIAFVRESKTPDDLFPIFPGRVKIVTPKGQIIVENVATAGVDAPDATTVYYKGPVTKDAMYNVTNGLISLLVNINYDENTQEVHLSLYKHHTLSFIVGSDEIYSITLL